jgi:exo-1,4-beta-D-glucosaminidase
MAQEIIPLDKNWTITPNGEWGKNGKWTKSNVYKPENSVVSDVPTTVFAALVENGKYKDPFFADNLAKIPTDWFNSNWKYAKSFEVSSGLLSSFARLCLDGINYRADIYLNGAKIASADTLKGAFRRFEVDITGKLKNGKNELAIVVFPPQPGDFTIGFVDWTPRPPDKNMGLWRGVSLRFNGEVSVNNPFVRTKINPANLAEASLTIESTVENHSGKDVKTTVKAQIDDIEVTKEVSLKPFEKKLVVLSPKDYPALNMKNAKLWWPVSLGDPHLYTLQLQCDVDSKVSDKLSKNFGIREISDYINSKGSRMYRVNGRDFQIRGGGWTDDLLLREDEKNVEAQVLYTKLMNLNCIRLEGFWGSSEKLYDLCDKYGILLMVGWSCQWEWEEYVGKPCDDFGGVKTPEEIDLVARSLNDHVLWLRNHPSIFVWVLGSDKLPRPALEKRYLSDLKLTDDTRPALMSCKMLESEITGSTGVKMNGPYDYVSPNYWYIDTANGGGFGFNTETGPGPQIPPMESLRKMFPENKLWPVNELWNYHSGRNQFNTIDNYVNAMNKRYGESKNIDEFVKKAQLNNYEAIRPMFEAFTINKREAGGIIQWMLNASWPKLYWQLYDYYLTPTSAFFGTQQALKPLNIIYNYGDKGLYVSNDLAQPYKNLTAEIKIVDINSKEVLLQKVPFDVAAYTSQKLFSLPELKDVSTTYFANLRILSSDGKELSRSFYWLSQKNDEPDFGKTDWYITPLKGYADFTALNTMPSATISGKSVVEQENNKTKITVSLQNTSDKLAFFIEMKLKGASSEQLILPANWTDNFVSLLPGETRSLTVTVNTSDLKGDKPVVEVKGFNTNSVKL